VNNDRYVCTKDHPWTSDKGRAIHPDAIYLKDKDYGDGDNVACYHCPNCDLDFEESI
jgi:hypothetical protein